MTDVSEDVLFPTKVSCFLLYFRLAKWTERKEYLMLHSYAVLRCITQIVRVTFFNLYFLCMPTGQWSKLEKIMWCRRKHQINLWNWPWVGNVLSNVPAETAHMALKKWDFESDLVLICMLTSQDSTELPHFGVYRNKWLNYNLNRS